MPFSRLFLPAFSVLLLFGAGCAAPGTVVQKEPDGTTITTDLASGTQTFSTSENGDITAGENLSIPKDFPKNIPVYSKGKITMISSNTKDHYLSMEISGGCQAVKDWYLAEVKKLGWSVVGDNSAPQISSLALTNATEGGTVSFLLEEKTCLLNFSTIRHSVVQDKLGIPLDELDIPSNP